jgi:MATE family multidrug resistance protein
MPDSVSYDSLPMSPDDDIDLKELGVFDHLQTIVATCGVEDAAEKLPIEMTNDSNDASESDEPLVLSKDAPLLTKLGTIGKMAIPFMASFFLYLGSNFIVMYFAGHITTSVEDTTVIFAGVSLGQMFANVSWFSIISGMTSALETLGAQNNGAKNYREVGIVLQRSVVVLSCFLPAVIIVWYYVADLFAFLGTDAAVCAVMRKYLFVRAASMPIDILSRSYAKYLMCIGLSKPDMYSQILSVAATAFFGGFVVHYLHGGYVGIAIAQVISAYVGFFGLVIFSWWDPAVQRTVQPPSIEAFHKLGEFAMLGLPGLAMLCAEWWAFEFLTMFASRRGAEAVAAQTIILNIASLAFMIPCGLSVAACAIIGNAIGANEMDLAKEFSKLSVGALFFAEAIISPSIVLFGRHFVSIFSKDPVVLNIAEHSIPVLAVFTLADGMSAVLSGITRGAGKQHLGAIGNIAAYYLVGLPMAWYLCFHTQLDVVGLMVGIAFAPLCTDTFMAFMIFCRPDYMFQKSVYERVQSSCAQDDGDVELARDNISHNISKSPVYDKEDNVV